MLAWQVAVALLTHRRCPTTPPASFNLPRFCPAPPSALPAPLPARSYICDMPLRVGQGLLFGAILCARAAAGGGGA